MYKPNSCHILILRQSECNDFSTNFVKTFTEYKHSDLKDAMDSIIKQFAICSANSWTRRSSDTAVVSEGNADMCYPICDQVQL